jgi:hypothetical protein
MVPQSVNIKPMFLGGSQFTLFGTREVMGKGRVYVYPFDLWFKKSKNLGCPLDQRF